MPEPRVLSFREALREAMVEEMERDESIFLMGEEVGHYKRAYKVSQGLLQRFSERRVVDTPIAELGLLAISIGVEWVGLRPIVELLTFNFSLLAIDQDIRTGAKLYELSAGRSPASGPRSPTACSAPASTSSTRRSSA